MNLCVCVCECASRARILLPSMSHLPVLCFQETLQKADEIFGPDNKDLYAIFEGLITRK